MSILPDSLPPTTKLYWQDPYRTAFTARVLHRLEVDGRPGVVLNRTCFYPAGGGQPHDIGALAGIPVVDVTGDEAGRIIHWLQAPLPDEPDEVHGEIDWPRRFDFMQQHSGQHLLSAAFQDRLYRPTIGFHLSDNSVTIDLPGPPPDDEAAARVLDFVQAAIAEARPIIARLHPLEEAIRLPLRKPPQVDGPVRVVEIQGLDWSACGGTHLRNTAEIGHLVITRMERRGDQTRVHFLAGGRAARDHLERIRITRELTSRLSTSLGDLPAAIQRMQDQVKQSQKAVRQARELLTRAEAQRLIAEAPHTGGVDVVYHILEQDELWDMESLIKMLISFPSVVAVLGSMEAGRARWIAGRSENVPMNMLDNLAELKETFAGVQGGGSRDLIQGVAPDFDTLTKALHLLQAFAFDLPDLISEE
ncbi:MAG TPA: alanyl-tRNA editing protein [Anaerolineae bacterium]|nr:alanyl-tRNA editing protein [Anaerolineae bacterium]